MLELKKKQFDCVDTYNYKFFTFDFKNISAKQANNELVKQKAKLLLGDNPKCDDELVKDYLVLKEEKRLNFKE